MQISSHPIEYRIIENIVSMLNSNTNYEYYSMNNYSEH